MPIGSTPVQSVQANTYVSGTSITFTIAAPTNGNFQAIQVHVSNAGSSVSSVTQTGASWLAAATSGPVNRDAEIWYAENVSGGGTTVTVNFTGTVGLSGILGYYTEWSGVATSTSLDAHSGTSGSSTTPTSPTATPTASTNELILVCGTTAGGLTVSSGPTAGGTGGGTYTGLVIASQATRLAAYQVVASTSGTYNCSWVMSGTGTWDAVIATFKAAAGGGGRTLFLSPGLDGLSVAGPAQFNPSLG